ncbi:MAG: hypothetical protein QXI89_00265 [Candidatus Anstonellales archaeon]
MGQEKGSKLEQRTRETAEKAEEQRKKQEYKREPWRKVYDWLLNKMKNAGYKIGRDGKITYNGKEVVIYDQESRVFVLPIDLLAGPQALAGSGGILLSEGELQKIKELLGGTVYLTKGDLEGLVEYLYKSSKNRHANLEDIKNALEEVFINRGTTAITNYYEQRLEAGPRFGVIITPTEKLQPTAGFGVRVEERTIQEIPHPEGRRMQVPTSSSGVAIGAEVPQWNPYVQAEVEEFLAGVSHKFGPYAGITLAPDLLDFRWLAGGKLSLETPAGALNIRSGKFVFTNTQMAAFYILAMYVNNAFSGEYQRDIRARGMIYVETGKSGEIIVYTGEAALEYIKKLGISPLEAAKNVLSSAFDFYKRTAVLADNLLKTEIKIEKTEDLSKHMEIVYKLLIFGDIIRAKGLMERILQALENGKNPLGKNSYVYASLEAFYETLQFASISKLEDISTFGFPPKFIFTLVEQGGEAFKKAWDIIRGQREKEIKELEEEKKQWISYSFYNGDEARKTLREKIAEKMRERYVRLNKLVNLNTLKPEQIREMAAIITYLSTKIDIRNPSSPVFYLSGDMKESDVVEVLVKAVEKLSGISNIEKFKKDVGALIYERKWNYTGDVISALSYSVRRILALAKTYGVSIEEAADYIKLDYRALIDFMFFKVNYGSAAPFMEIKTGIAESFATKFGLDKDNVISKIDNRFREIVKQQYEDEKKARVPLLSPFLSLLGIKEPFTPFHYRFYFNGEQVSLHDFLSKYDSGTINNYINELEKLNNEALEKTKDRINELKEEERRLIEKLKKFNLSERAKYHVLLEISKIRSEIRNAYLSYFEDVLTVLRNLEPIIYYYTPLLEVEDGKLAKEILGESEYEALKKLLGNEGEITRLFNDLYKKLEPTQEQKEAEKEQTEFSSIKKVINLYTSIVNNPLGYIKAVGGKIGQDGVESYFLLVPDSYEAQFLKTAQEMATKKTTSQEFKNQMRDDINDLYNMPGLCFRDFSGRYEEYFNFLRVSAPSIFREQSEQKTFDKLIEDLKALEKKLEEEK